MSNSKLKICFDQQSENIVLSHMLSRGSEAHGSISHLITTSDFFTKESQCLYKCLEHICFQSDVSEITVPSVLSSAKDLGVYDNISKDDINELKSYTTLPEELVVHSKKIKFWSILRSLRKKLSESNKLLESASPETNILDVVSSVEDKVFGFLPGLIDDGDMVNLGEFSVDHINYIAENPTTQAGLPTGYMKYDKSIGGGYRRGTVNIVGARPKVGKSTFCLNVAKNLADKKIPVLYLDTEMKKETQATKLVSLTSKVSLSSIETGEFASKENMSSAVTSSLKEVSEMPITHVSAAGKTPSETLSIVRRWLTKEVGRDDNGHLMDCLVILDYLKTMDLSDLGNHQEYQFLGDYITKLHNFAVKYDVPILSTVQLNRDGITREDGGVVSGSDRILWLCSSLAYLKKKTDEDVASGDSKSNGDRKIVVVDTRYGEGMDASCEYINMVCNLDRCEMVEGRYNFEVIEEEHNLSDEGYDDIEF